MSTTRGLGTRIDSLKTYLGRALPARLRGPRRARGAAELSVVLVSGSLVAGVFFGQGLHHTAVDIADGLTWLSDSPSGEVVEVNPATGELQNRQLVGKPGDDLDVAQFDGQMYVTNQTTGQLMSYDVSNLLVSGQRRVTAGGAVNTLDHDGRVFLVDTDQSTISDIDPVTTDAIGTIWVSPAGLADVAIDGTGTVWALEDDGTLHALKWSDDTMQFDETDKQHIDLSGQGSVLVAHDKGVTVFGPDNGIVQQVGTGDDIRADAPKVAGTILAPENAPSDLVPVTTDDGMLVIVTPDHVQDVDMTTLACSDPGTPAVFHDVVYVPCTGNGEDAGKVVKIDPDGVRVGDDIATPGSSDPELVLDDASLIINTPGAAHGLVVHSDGTLSGIVREDPAVPVTTPAAIATAPQQPVTDVLDHLLGSPTTPPAPSHAPPPSSPPSSPAGEPHSPGAGPSDDPSSPATDDPGACLPVVGCVGTPGDGHDHPGHHGDNPSSPGHHSSDNPTDSPTHPGGTIHTDPVGAPTNVQAVALAEGQVQITWDDDMTPTPDGFIIRDTNKHEYGRTKNYTRQAIINVTPGVSLSFTVSAVLGHDETESKPTAPVVSTARPGSPTVSGSAVYSPSGNTQRFVATVTWTEAPANGAEVTEYDITAQVPDTTAMTNQTDGDARSTSFTWTCDMGADPGCRVGGNVSVTVTPINSIGGGQAGAATITAPPQPDAPLPPEGTTVVDPSSPKKTTADVNGVGAITLKLRPPTAWAKFPGSCAYSTTDGDSAAIACSATTITLAFNLGPRYIPDSGDVDHTVTFTATDNNGTAHSKAYTYRSHQEPQPQPVEPDPAPTAPCDGCQIP